MIVNLRATVDIVIDVPEEEARTPIEAEQWALANWDWTDGENFDCPEVTVL